MSKRDTDIQLLTSVIKSLQQHLAFIQSVECVDNAISEDTMTIEIKYMDGLKELRGSSDEG